MQMSALKGTIIALISCWYVASTAMVVEAHAQDTTQPLSSDEKLELEIYRKSVADLQGQVEALKGQVEAGALGNDERARYLSSVYRQRAAIGELAVRAFEWQLFAGNVILALVAILMVSGIGLGAYQLIEAAKIAKASINGARSLEKTLSASDQPSGPDAVAGAHADKISLETGVELSRDKLSLQTSVIGLLVLLVSGVFLLLFLREVYPIQDINHRLPSASATPATSEKTQ
jgi:hypothetical protein